MTILCLHYFSLNLHCIATQLPPTWSCFIYNFTWVNSKMIWKLIICTWLTFNCSVSLSFAKFTLMTHSPVAIPYKPALDLISIQPFIHTFFIYCIQCPNNNKQAAKSDLLSVSVFAFIAYHRPVTDHDRVVVCYISTWAVYRKGLASYSLDHFDPKLCTHAIYAFAGLDVEQNAMKSLGK